MLPSREYEEIFKIADIPCLDAAVAALNGGARNNDAAVATYFATRAAAIALVNIAYNLEQIANQTRR